MAWHAREMTRLPSLYKARGVPLKMPVCAICLDRTRGRTLERDLTHGVRIWLCEGHHSVAFMRANAGRDFAVTLLRIWRAQGCLTRSRSRALDAHLKTVRALGRPVARRRPGRMRGRGCGGRRRSASRGGIGCWARSRVCASGMRAITRPCRACARCSDGLQTAAGSAHPNQRGASRRAERAALARARSSGRQPP